MNDDKLRSLLREAQDHGPGESSAEQEKILSNLKRDRSRLRRIRIVTAVLWGTTLVGWIGAGVMALKLQDMGLSDSRVSDVMTWYLLIVMSSLVAAVVCTVSMFIRRRSLNQREILTSLSAIEKALRELSNKAE